MGRSRRREQTRARGGPAPAPPAAPRGPGRPARTWLCAGLLLAVTTLAFAPTFGAEFVKWDDQFYVEENPLLLDTAGLQKIWDPITREAPQYYPILFSAYWIEYRLWGLRASGYHAVTLLWHLANVVLVLALMRSFGTSPWVATVTAGLFAVHPVQAASVAWISEQKNTLSGLFYLVAFLLYLRHRRTAGWPAYVGCLASFVFALLSKNQTATLPVSLLLADWLLQRSGRLPRMSWSAVTARLAPMVLLAGLGAAVTVYFEATYFQHQPYAHFFSAGERLLIAANAASFYVHTFLAPVRLAPIYPEWPPISADPSWWAAVALCVAAAATLLAGWRRIAPLTLWGILHFFAALLPVLRLVSFNYQTYTTVADHFLYLPCIGGGLALATAAEVLVSRIPAAPAQRRSLALLGVLVLCASAGQTYRGATHWRSNLAFWTRVLERDPEGFLGNINLGNHYRYRGEWAHAAPYYRRAAEIRPRVDYPFRRYVQALRNSEGPEGALAACNEKLQRAPSFAPAYLERAITYEQMGRDTEAARDYEEARRLDGERGGPR